MTRSPLKLTAEALSKSTSDKLEATHDPLWSEMRTGRAERPIHCYAVRNLTKETLYDVEIFLDDGGEPWGWCGCPATVVCKHIVKVAKELGTVIETRE